MKPFDLEAAKSGRRIMFANGDPVKFIAHIPEAAEGCRVLVMNKEGVICNRSEHGGYYPMIFSDGDLIFDDPDAIVMAPRVVWVNFYNSYEVNYFDTEESADKHNGKSHRIGGKAYPVEIEE